MAAFGAATPMEASGSGSTWDTRETGSPLQLPQPGSPGFTPALVDAVLAAPSLRGWQFDPTLFAVLFIAITVRRGGVIVDVSTTRAARTAGIDKVARGVVAITESVFGLPSRNIHLSESSTVRDFSLDAHAVRVVVITGLEDASSPVRVKLRNEMTRAESDGVPPLLVWVRNEDLADDPNMQPWLVDLFACWCSEVARDLEEPPMGLTRMALVPPDYIKDMRALLLLSHVHPPLESHMNNLLAALSMHRDLSSNISARASANLTSLVRIQRALATPFELPPDWKKHLRAWRATHWPDTELDHGVTSALVARIVSAGADGTRGFGGGPGGIDTWGQRAGETPTAESMLGPGANDWYCMPENVAAAWALAVRHRVRLRRPGESTLFALNGSAQERVQYARKDAEPPQRDVARKRRAEVDEALQQILIDV